MIGWELERAFTFEAAHRLPNVSAGHPCARLHGHSYRVVLHLEGPLHAQYGWVVDFDHVMAQAETVRAQLDHRLLNEIPGLENPTAELIGRWIYDALADALPELVGVSLHETSDSCARYRGR